MTSGRAVVTACCVVGDRVLLAYDEKRGMWTLPGGPTEKGEPPQAAAIRNFRLATGWTLTVLEETPCRVVEKTRNARYSGLPQSIYIGSVENANRPPRPVNSRTFRWFSERDLDDVSIAPALLQVVRVAVTENRVVMRAHPRGPMPYLPGELVESSGTVLILGRPDSGKSTLTDHLIELGVATRPPIGWIDADPGQTHLGPPSCLWGAIVVGPFARVVCGSFLGSLSPAGYESVFASSLQRIRAILQAVGAKRILIDSPGLVFGRQAVALHRQQIDLLRPEWIVALDGDGTLASLLHELDLRRAIRPPPLAQCSPRTLRQRLAYHRRMLAQYFHHGQVVRVPLRGRTVSMLGAQLSPEDIGNHLLGHICAFTSLRLPLLGMLRAFDRDRQELVLRLPSGRRPPLGSLTIGALYRTPSGQLRHEPSLADPENVRLHFPANAGV